MLKKPFPAKTLGKGLIRIFLNVKVINYTS